MFANTPVCGALRRSLAVPAAGPRFSMTRRAAGPASSMLSSSASTLPATAAAAPGYALACRHFGSGTSLEGLNAALTAELDVENKEKPKGVDFAKAFAAVGFALDVAGETSVLQSASRRTEGGFDVKLSWMLAEVDAPPAEDADAPGKPDEREQMSTEFTVLMTRPGSEKGLAFYCNTTSDDEKSRFYICNVQAVERASDMEDKKKYSGPNFGDLDAKLQEAFDKVVVEEAGVTDGVADLIDQAAAGAEQKHYMRWLSQARALTAARA